MSETTNVTKQFLDKDGLNALWTKICNNFASKDDLNSLTDTKNTTGATNTNSKIYLVGATSQSTNPITYSHDTAYIGSDGYLYSNSKKVNMDIVPTLIKQGTEIPKDANLNTVEYLKIGIYYCKTYATSLSLDNCPVNDGFRMEVYSYQSDNIDDSILTTATHVYRLRKIITLSGKQYYQLVNSAEEKGVFTYGDWQYIPTTKATIDTTDTNGSTVTNGDASTPVYINSDGKFASCTGVYSDSKSCIPKASLTYNLGSSTKLFYTTYTHNIDTASGSSLKLKAANTEHISMVGGVINTTAHIIPTKNSTYNLGSADYKWKNIYASNFIENGTNISTIYADKSYADYCSSYLHSANRAQFCKPAGVTIEYSTNGGSTWVDYGATDDQKISFFSGISQDFVLGKKLSTKATASDMLRITMDATAMGIYTSCKCLLLNISTNGSTNFRVKVEKSMKGSVDTFDTLIESQTLTGWSGWNRIPIGYSFGGGNTQNYNIAKLRLTFSSDGAGSSYTSGAHAKVLDMEVLGGTYWATPHTMAKTGHLYTWDASGNAIFGESITAKAINATESITAKAINATGNVDINGNITAVGIKKTDSSDSYVLLGGGGHKSINRFVTTFSKSTGNINSNLTGSEHYPYICRLGNSDNHAGSLPEGCSYGNLAHFTGSLSDTAFELLGDYHNEKLLFRSGGWNADGGTINSAEWKQIAFTSDIPTIPTSLPNPNSLTIQGNGTTLTNGVYDGSAAKTVNITPASIGAAESSHTHDYLPLDGGTITGALTISGTDVNTANLHFNRALYNYISGPSGSTIHMCPGGISKSSTTGYVFGSAAFYPGTTNGYSIGTSSLQWNNIYGKTLYEDGESLVNKYAAKDHTHSFLTGGGVQHVQQSATTRNLTNFPATKTLFTGGWNTSTGGYSTTWGTTLDISYSTYYQRLAFNTTGRIEYFRGINSNNPDGTSATLTKIGDLAYLTDLPTIPTTLPNPNSLTIQGNNKRLGSYNGSEATTITITPEDIGAAPSAHTHTTVNIQTSTTNSYYPMTFVTSTGAGDKTLHIGGFTGTTSTGNGIRYNPYSNTCYCSGGFYEASDERLKNFGDDIEVDLDKLSKLSKKYFTWKDDESNTQHIGVSAQEVQELYPEIVNVIDEEGHLSVSYDKLSVVALKGIDVLTDKVKSLEERLERLEKLIEGQLCQKL